MRLVITGILAFIIFIMISAFKWKIEAQKISEGNSEKTEVISRDSDTGFHLFHESFLFPCEWKKVLQPASYGVKVNIPFREII